MKGFAIMTTLYDDEGYQSGHELHGVYLRQERAEAALRVQLIKEARSTAKELEGWFDNDHAHETWDGLLQEELVRVFQTLLPGRPLDSRKAMIRQLRGLKTAPLNLQDVRCELPEEDALWLAKNIPYFGRSKLFEIGIPKGRMTDPELCAACVLALELDARDARDNPSTSRTKPR